MKLSRRTRRLWYNYLRRHLKFNFNDYITTFKIIKNLMKQKVIKIFFKLFQLIRQKGHGYEMI